MNWSNRYVGLPWAEHGRECAGCDCWGLACIVYRDELGITLPEYLGYATVAELAEIAALVAGATASRLWVRQEAARPFDIAVFRRGRLDAHIGIVLQPGLMLHMVEGAQASIESYEAGRWKHRLTGLYRHALVVSGWYAK